MTTSGELTRAERQQLTRQRLLQAAQRVFAERGYAGATVPEIARVAGFTTGAVYSNFEGKEELFLTLMDKAMRTFAQRRADAMRGVTSTRERLRRAAAQWAQFLRDEPDAFLLLIEFWSYAVRHPQLRARFAERLADERARLASVLASAAEGGGAAISPAAHIGADLAVVMQALGLGFALQQLADPEGNVAGSFALALDRLAGVGISHR
jgi:AcrR family transcriptional regulator